MPIKLNAGLSRKISDANYGSRGASVNIEMELDSTLVDAPGKLKDKIRHLFDVVRTSLTEELNTGGQPRNGLPSNGHTTGDGANHPPLKDPGSPPPRRATTSQVRAITAIARSQRLDLTLILKNRFQATRPEELSIRQASELIDTLKSPSGV